MTQQELTSQEELWQEATAETNYWKFPKNERVQLGITGWKLERKDVPDFHDKTKIVNKIEFSATVFYSSSKNEPVQTYEFSTLSKRFMDAFNPIRLKYKNTDTVVIRVKQIGEGNNVQYDIEVVE